MAEISPLPEGYFEIRLVGFVFAQITIVERARDFFGFDFDDMPLFV